MKTPVVLLPALLCRAGLFIHQIKALEDDYDFFVPENGTDSSVEDAAKRILKSVPECFILGGVSMGGYIAFEILRQAPERVKALVLMDTNARSDPPAAREKRLKMMDTAQKQGIEAVITPTLLDIIAPVHRDNDVIRHILAHMAETTGVERYLNEQKLIMNRPDSENLLSEIKCPVLVAGGERDTLSPPEAMDAVAAKIPNSAHVIIDNSGHLPPLENPAAVTASWRLFFEKNRI